MKFKSFFKQHIVRISAILLVLIVFFPLIITTESNAAKATWWKFQSIDTMKYSRDLSREKLHDPTFNAIINQQVKQIAETGATHVAIATPYDEEFYPFLTRWVGAARKNNLKIWFRGNWSGWEGWFGYPKITRNEHIKKSEDFIAKHGDIFADGDVFSACPECENGGPGDPRFNGDIDGHRKFLIDEYKMTKKAFQKIGKNITSNFDSMNGDVAMLVMDKKTTASLDGIVTIDHYTATPQKLVRDIKYLAEKSGGKIVLGEFGAPIPDINGDLSEADQAEWISEAMLALVQTSEVAGINYWTNTGGSTALWKENGDVKKAVAELTSFYKAPITKIVIKDEAGFEVKQASIVLDDRKFSAEGKGSIYIPYFKSLNNVTVMADGYISKKSVLTRSDEIIIILSRENESLFYKILKAIKTSNLYKIIEDL